MGMRLPVMLLSRRAEHHYCQCPAGAMAGRFGPNVLIALVLLLLDLGAFFVLVRL